MADDLSCQAISVRPSPILLPLDLPRQIQKSEIFAAEDRFAAAETRFLILAGSPFTTKGFYLGQKSIGGEGRGEKDRPEDGWPLSSPHRFRYFSGWTQILPGLSCLSFWPRSLTRSEAIDPEHHGEYGHKMACDRSIGSKGQKPGDEPFCFTLNLGEEKFSPFLGTTDGF